MLIERAQIAAKLESEEGTAETLTNAEALLVFNPKFNPEIEQFRRNPVRSTLSQLASVSGKRRATLEFDVELKGSGTKGTPPEYGDLLKACKMSETIVAVTSVTYAPASSGDSSITLALYEDGVCYKMWGARGDMSLKLKAGEPVMIHFVFTAADFSVTDVALLTGCSYDATIPQPFMNASFQVSSYSAIVENLDLALKNKVALRPSANAASGHLSAVITNREPGGSLDPEMVLVATEDFFGDWRSGTTGALTATIGSVAGNIATITAPAVRYTGISPADREGIRTLGLDFDLAMSSGDDELSIALT
ncbi:MAG: hypothetical protein JW882_09835 [Deltaproteobacteria bacterium]|nr:hypothetical protein [Deltaproteobacteria bacterium]